MLFTPTPSHCDVCGGKLGSVMYDAKIQGMFGCVCHSCFTSCGGKLGIGKGQKYKRTKEGFEYVKGNE